MKMRINDAILAKLEFDDASVDVQQDSYGWTVRPNHGEWEMTIKWTSRQDGKTVWAIMLAEVDGDVKIVKGLCPWGEANDAMIAAAGVVTEHWITPIESF